MWPVIDRQICLSIIWWCAVSLITNAKVGGGYLFRMDVDYYHNIKVLSEKTGQLVVVRCPNADNSHSDFLPCRFWTNVLFSLLIRN